LLSSDSKINEILNVKFSETINEFEDLSELSESLDTLKENNHLIVAKQS
jgi:hypothetical protein